MAGFQNKLLLAPLVGVLVEVESNDSAKTSHGIPTNLPYQSFSTCFRREKHDQFIVRN